MANNSKREEFPVHLNYEEIQKIGMVLAFHWASETDCLDTELKAVFDKVNKVREDVRSSKLN